MATKVGTFAKPTGASGATAVISGVGATPKFVLLWTSGLTTADVYSSTDDLKNGAGWFNATDAGCIAIYSRDGTSPSDTYRTARASALVGITAGGTIEWEATVDAIGPDGFTLAFTPNDANAVLINYLCLTGADLANSTIGTFTVPASTGSFTPVTGLSYQPDAALFLSIGLAGTSLPQGDDMAEFAIGIATGAASEGAIAIRSRDGLSTAVSHRRTYASACLTINHLTSNFSRVLCDFTSFNADGITLNASEVSGENPGVLVLYALMGGGSWHAGTLSTSSSAGDISTTDPGFLPDGVLAFGVFPAGDDLGGIHALFSVGATDGTAARCISTHDRSGASPPSQTILQDSSAVLVEQFNGSTTNREEFGSFDADGFTLNQTTSTGGRVFKYLAFNTGEAAVPLSSAGIYYRRFLQARG